MTLFERIKERAWSYAVQAEERYRKLSVVGKAALWIWVALHFVFMGLWWYIGAERIFAYFAGLADDIRDLPYGWAILVAIIIVTSLPPLIGYGTAQTLVGFAYGVTPGFYISAGACLAGGAFAFVVIRRLIHIFAPYIHRQPTFEALSKAVRVKGLPLMMMIRLCPFPYPYSNLFFASIESVTLGEFLLATLAITPKLLLHVFIGHRTYLFADPESRKTMDSTSRWLNGAFMVGGSLLGFGVSWYLYRLTMRYVAEAAAQDGVDESDLEAGLLEDVDEMLGMQEREGRPDEEGGGGGKRSGEGPWEEDRVSSFEREREEQEREGTKGRAAGGHGRSDSLAWGLGDEEAGEAEGEELVSLGTSAEQQKRDRRVD
ncbi:hypothetical protein JCM8097_006339 [Rhodosporidiobolus ruineniae]